MTEVFIPEISPKDLRNKELLEKKRELYLDQKIWDLYPMK